MSQTITITKLPLSFTPSGNVTASIYYAVGENGAFTQVTNNAVVFPTGFLQTPVSIGGLPDLGTAYLKAKINCNGTFVVVIVKLLASEQCVFYKIENNMETGTSGTYSDCITGAILPITVPSGPGGIAYQCARKNSINLLVNSNEDVIITPMGGCKGGTTTTSTTQEIFPTTTTTTAAEGTTTTSTTMADVVGKMTLNNVASIETSADFRWTAWQVKIDGNTVASGGLVPQGSSVQFDVIGYTGAEVEVILGLSSISIANGVFSSGSLGGSIAGNVATFTGVDISGNVSINLSK